MSGKNVRPDCPQGLLSGPDMPDEEIDDIWAQEAEKRLNAYREGRLGGIPMEEIFQAEENKCTLRGLPK